MTPGEDPL